MEQEAAQRKGGRPKKGEKPVEQIRQVSEHDRKTNTVLAKASGTNRKYLEPAKQLFDEHPEYVQQAG